MARKKEISTVSTGKVIGYIRHGARCPASEQHAAMAMHGITDVHEDGAKAGGTMALITQDFDGFLRYLKPSDTVAVLRAVVFDPGPRGSHRRRLMLAQFDAVEARCACIWELSTGLRSTAKADRDKMRDGAVDTVLREALYDRPGRPARPLSDKEQAAIDLHWRSAKHATDKAASAAIRAMGFKRLTASVLIKRAGKSGRPYETKRKSKKR